MIRKSPCLTLPFLTPFKRVHNEKHTFPFLEEFNDIIKDEGLIEGLQFKSIFENVSL